LNLWASGGSATLNLNTNEFSKIRIISPSKEIIDTFNDATDPIFKEILSKSLEIVNLSNIRDSLLPKLMSGKIRVEC
jgi:type I restriction enzyme, S subunit